MLSEKLTKLGANFANKFNANIILDFGDELAELSAIRSSAAVADMGHVKIYEYPEYDGMDYLDTVLPANILKLRYGKVLDTFLPDENGNVVGEALVANIDDKLFAIVENIDPSACAPLLAGGSAKDISADYKLFSLDGPLAWKVAEKIFSSDVLTLAYMSVDKLSFEGECVYILRVGRAGEYGYQFIVPNAKAEIFFDKLYAETLAIGGTCAGFEAHATARMQGNFFNCYREGKAVGNPIELGLQWMIDFSKDSFIGSKTIFDNRQKGAERRLCALVSEKEIVEGASVFNAGTEIGKIVSAKKLSDAYLSLALIDSDFAYAGFSFSDSKDCDNDSLRSVSRPTIFAQSLLNNMQDS